jgi:hypothetical protein
VATDNQADTGRRTAGTRPNVLGPALDGPAPTTIVRAPVAPGAGSKPCRSTTYATRRRGRGRSITICQALPLPGGSRSTHVLRSSGTAEHAATPQAGSATVGSGLSAMAGGDPDEQPGSEAATRTAAASRAARMPLLRTACGQRSVSGAAGGAPAAA